MAALWRFVAFFSYATNLVAGDTNGLRDIFVHDRQTGTTTRVSVDSTGTEGNDASHYTPSISADGRYVGYFSSASNLVAGDTNGNADIFVSTNLAAFTSESNSGLLLNHQSGLSVASQAAALAALDSLETHMLELQNVGAQVGAATSRFESAAANLHNQALNYKTAASRITDIDVAQEMSQLIRNQILQQAGTAVLAQANVVLELLKTAKSDS